MFKHCTYKLVEFTECLLNKPMFFLNSVSYWLLLCVQFVINSWCEDIGKGDGLFCGVYAKSTTPRHKIKELYLILKQAILQK